MKTQKRNQGFTLIELMVVITIIAVLASFAMPAFTRMQESAKITKDTSNIRQIILACKSFATDNEGSYPSWMIDDQDPNNQGDLSTSTDAFNVLIQEGYMDTESIFWYKTTNPEKQRPPRENNQLEANEVTYTYVKGQLDTTFSRSPLVADEQESPGSYGEYHPWLSSKKAVVGYCGGNVAAERLDSKEPGAIVKTKDGLEIFKQKSGSDEGEASGLLAVKQDNVLNP
ncbi:MAG: type II secretion system protein [Verrucomicrobiae bacterium]|nr:type II secretion system protein [Verrucomicrobiae bacterium]